MSTQKYLTKSIFLQAMTCPTKLFYLTHNYPTVTEENEYLKLLAEGGFMIGALAHVRYPEGVDAARTGNIEADFLSTREKLLRKDCTLFEATFLSGKSLAVADVVRKKGNVLYLTEVKSKSIDTSDGSDLLRSKKGAIRSEWLEYLYDITYQYAIVQRCFPQLEIQPSLLLVDKAKRVSVDAIHQTMTLCKGDGNGRGPSVTFNNERLEDLVRATEVLTEIDVHSEVSELLPKVVDRIDTFENVLSAGEKVTPRLTLQCRTCEFNGEGLTPHGYDECWSSVQQTPHHLFDLFFGSTIKVDGVFLIDTLLEEGKTSLFDIPLEQLKGKRGERQRVQIECTRENREWFDPKLASFMKDARYPLHFIDFETTRTALPFHRGMRPFEQIAFQWSCHTVLEKGGEPFHTEWINTEPMFPNFSFAQSLMNTLSSNGTVLTWASHEGTVLSDILSQMNHYGFVDETLTEFLTLLTSSKGSQGRLVDMNQLAIDFYFHPLMKGKTSIKKVFPAVWFSNEKLRDKKWFKPYEVIEGGVVKDPYKLLPALTIDGKEVTVQEGTAAMRAYEELLFGSTSKDGDIKERWKALLLQYCKLDTLAMVAIWEHWEQLALKD